MALTKRKPAARATKHAKFRFVFSQRRATRLNRLSLPTACSMQARPLYSVLAKKVQGLLISLILYGMTGAMPRSRAIWRLVLLAYPLSPIAARGSALVPRLSKIGKCGASPFSLPVRSKTMGCPSKSVFRWILVEKPPRDLPTAWPSCPLLPRPPTHAHEQSSSRTSAPNWPMKIMTRDAQKTVRKYLPCSADRSVSRRYSICRTAPAKPVM